MKGCLLRLAAAGFWLGVFCLNLACALVFVGATSVAWRWGALLGSGAAGALTLAVSRSRLIAQGLAEVSEVQWSESYETDYRQTTGRYPGAAVAGTLMLLWTFIGTMLLLFDN